MTLASLFGFGRLKLGEISVTETPALSKPAPIWRQSAYWGVGLILVILAVLCLLFLFRATLAETFAKRWCADKQLACQFTVTEIGLNAIQLTDLSMTHADKPGGVSLQSIDLALTWPGLSLPNVNAIKVEKPRVEAFYSDEGFSVGGLETLLSGDGTGTAPQIDAREGQLDLTTTAGTIAARFDVIASWPESGSIQLEFDPAELQSGTDFIVLNRGGLNLTLNDGLVTGGADLNVPRAQVSGVRAQELALSAEIIDSETRDMGVSLLADQLAVTDLGEVEHVQSTATLRFAEPVPSLAGSPLDLITHLTADLNTAAAEGQGYSVQGTALELAAVRAEPGEDMQLSLETRLDQVTARDARLEALQLSFDGELTTALDRLYGTGNLLLSGAQVEDPLIDALFTPPRGDAPWNGHITAFQSATRRALLNFTLGGDYNLSARTATDWTLTFPDAIALTSLSGLSAIMTPNGISPSVTLKPEQVKLAGVFSLSDGGGPSLDIDLTDLHYDRGTVELTSGGVTLQPWRVDGNTVATRLNQLNLSYAGEGLRLQTLGELRIDGTAFGIDVDQSRLFGGVNAVRGAEGWRVETQGRDCLGLDIARTRTAGDLVLKDIRLAICPEDGRFIRQQDGRPTGQIRLGNVAIPFTGNSFSGRAELTQALLNWQAGDRLDLDLQAEALSLPMRIGTRSLNLDAAAPRLGFNFDEQTRLRATSGTTVLSGELVPANVTLPQFSLNGVLGSAGLTGLATSSNVRITDRREDPFYQPLLADLEAQFTGRQMRMTGPVRLADRGTTLGDVTLDIDLLSLNGEAVLQSRLLSFERRGLQPNHITDRLRGVLSNGRGDVTGNANITITGGQLSGTGRFEAREFGFDTFRIGAIDGVTGQLFFDDLMALDTPPGQVFTVGSISPGLPLSDGTVSFQLVGGREALIERASWPFAGGRLEIEPTRWTIAGESDLINVTADQIELASLVEALTLPDLQAEGTVSGTFPIELVEGNAFVRNARLIADEKGGRVSYTGEGLNAAGQSNETVGAAVSALRDFRFSVLELGANGNLIGKLVVSIDLLGFNPDVLGGSEFRFRIDVDSELAQLIKSGQRAATSNWITEAVLANESDDETE
ncbi:MAG: YdbH domain-containing protein [Henriciella sp.]|nr:YdbH domain-containing protein [Henriciella sp.]